MSQCSREVWRLAKDIIRSHHTHKDQGTSAKDFSIFEVRVCVGGQYRTLALPRP